MSANDDSDDNGNQKPDYAVGYRRPPKASQFKPGMSGNRKGRGKGRKNTKSILQEQLHGRMEVKINGQYKKMSRLEALIVSLVQRALKGEPKAVDKVFSLIDKYGIDLQAMMETADLTKNEQGLIESYKQQWLEEQRTPEPKKENEGRKK